MFAEDAAPLFEGAQVVSLSQERYVLEFRPKSNSKHGDAPERELQLAYHLFGAQTVIEEGVVTVRIEPGQPIARAEIPNRKHLSAKKLEFSLAY